MKTIRFDPWTFPKQNKFNFQWSIKWFMHGNKWSCKNTDWQKILSRSIILWKFLKYFCCFSFLGTTPSTPPSPLYILSCPPRQWSWRMMASLRRMRSITMMTWELRRWRPRSWLQLTGPRQVPNQWNLRLPSLQSDSEPLLSRINIRDGHLQSFLVNPILMVIFSILINITQVILVTRDILLILVEYQIIHLHQVTHHKRRIRDKPNTMSQ